MPFNGSGVFSILNTFIPNTTILSSAVNANFTDIASGLSNCLTRDGQAGMTAAFKAISGALATPGITFTSDATSGLYLSASGAVGLVSHSLGMILNTNVYSCTAATVQAGGSGYAVGDTITETGGTAIIQPVLTVATLSGTAVATVTVTVPGFYTVKPSNPVAQGSTSGSGTSCTLNLTYNDPTSSDYRAVFTDQAGSLLWQKFGASSFVSGLMAKANGLDFATAIGASNIAAVLGGTLAPSPQGRLSLLTGSPVMASSQSAKTTIYYTPYMGTTIPIYNGTSMVPTTFSELSIATTDTANSPAAIGASKVNDWFVWNDAGTLRLVHGPDWTSDTARSAGTQIVRVNGIYLNNADITNGPIAKRGTYVGTTRSNASSQLNWTFGSAASGGGAANLAVWNMFNRVDVATLVADTAATWTYTSATVRTSDNSVNNRISFVSGLAEEGINISFTQRLLIATASGATASIGFGLNGTSAYDFSSLAVSPSATTTYNAAVTCTGVYAPQTGYHFIQAMEASDGTNNSTFVGGSANYQFIGRLRM